MYRPKIYHSIWHGERKDRQSSACLRQADSSSRFAEIAPQSTFCGLQVVVNSAPQVNSTVPSLQPVRHSHLERVDRPPPPQEIFPPLPSICPPSAIARVPAATARLRQSLRLPHRGARRSNDS